MFKRKDLEGIREKLAEIVGEENVLTGELETALYSYDASMARAKPCGVAHFDSPEQIAPVVKLLYDNKIHFSPRAAGTNLSGGAVNLKGGFILNLARLDKIHQIDTRNGIAVVEPGVVNLALQEELEKFGFFYAPDPASQKVSTIGGNIAENAGGPQCLKYGVTSDNLLKLEVVLPDGSERTFSLDDPGFELMSLFPQSEGTLGIVKKAWLKILPIPKYIKTVAAHFPSIEDSILAVTGIIAEGIIPRSLEAMDKFSIQAALKGLERKIPEDTEALLLIELDSDDLETLEKELVRTGETLKKNRALRIETAKDEKEREFLWKIRKESYPALARMSPNVMVEDGAVPRPLLPRALKEIKEILNSYKLKAGLVFHAGDGNLHPNVIFDERDLEETRRVRKAGHEILKTCIKLGGTISGEHGVGVEKRAAMNWLYSQETLEIFRKIKAAFDPDNLLNPDKKIPVSKNQIPKLEREEPGLSDKAKDLLNEMKFRDKTGERTAISGSGSKLNPREIPGNCKILKTAGLDKVIDLDRENFTVTAEAGLKISELRDLLRREKLSVDIPEDLNGTLGGMIASREFRELRSLLLGADLALAGGDLIRLGGKTMKDVSGYDVLRMMIGSRGTLALILSVTLKIRAAGSQKRDFKRPGEAAQFGDLHLKIKQVFDPRNLLNPWIMQDKRIG